MALEEYTDENEVLTVRVDGLKADSVLIRNSWNTHYPDAEALSLALTALFKQALPAPEAESQPEPRDDSASGFPTATGPMSDAQWNGFWNEFNLWRRKSKQLREQYAAGERTVWEPVEDAVDDAQRVAVDYVQGRFESIALRPDWVEGAGIQEINDAVNGLVHGLTLVQEPPEDSEMAAIEEHARNARRYLS